MTELWPDIATIHAVVAKYIPGSPNMNAATTELNTVRLAANCQVVTALQFARHLERLRRPLRESRRQSEDNAGGIRRRRGPGHERAQRPAQRASSNVSAGSAPDVEEPRAQEDVAFDLGMGGGDGEDMQGELGESGQGEEDEREGRRASSAESSSESEDIDDFEDEEARAGPKAKPRIREQATLLRERWDRNRDNVAKELIDAEFCMPEDQRCTVRHPDCSEKAMYRYSNIAHSQREIQLLCLVCACVRVQLGIVISCI
jgi:hypothetical protein